LNNTFLEQQRIGKMRFKLENTPAVPRFAHAHLKIGAEKAAVIKASPKRSIAV